MKIRILKCHGSSNDFVLIDLRKNMEVINDVMKKIIAITLCNRKSIVGADGILYIDESKIADCKMRIFNADGSEAEMCGNGIRIVGRYVAENVNKDEVTVENITGIVYNLERANKFFKKVTAFQLSLPPVNFNTSKIPLNIESDVQIDALIPIISDKFRFTALSLPNPHIISFVKNISENELIYLGEKANSTKSIFPNGVNLSLVKKISDDSIFVSTFERGVGMTYACGTAMFGAVAAGVKNKLLSTNKSIKVINRGGFVYVKVHNDWGGIMIGNATYVYTAEINFDFSNPKNLNEFQGEAFVDEIASYGELTESIESIIGKYSGGINIA